LGIFQIYEYSQKHKNDPILFHQHHFASFSEISSGYAVDVDAGRELGTVEGDLVGAVIGETNS